MHIKKSIVLAVLSLSSNLTFAAQGTGQGNIIMIENGWGGEGIAVHHTQSMSGCSGADPSLSLQLSKFFKLNNQA